MEHIGEKVIIHIDVDEYITISKLLDNVRDKEISTFEFKGYVFDFTNYNPKSVKVVAKASKLAIYYNLLALAC